MVKVNTKKISNSLKKAPGRPVTKKPNVQSNKPSSIEERDLKAKNMVKELLHDIPLTIERNDNNNEHFNKPNNEQQGGIKWLEEQISQLTEQVETLRNKLANTENDNQKLLNDYQNIGNGDNDQSIKIGVLNFFKELQDNYLRNKGVNPSAIPNTPNLIIWPAALINRMVQFIPFLDEYKVI